MGRVRGGPWVLALLAWCACRGEAEAPTGASWSEVERAAASRPDVAPEPDAASEPAVASDGAATSAQAEVTAPAPPQAAGEGPRPPPTVVTPLPELCRQACANTLRILVAELPADAAPSMRAELERALGAECHGRCMQRASIASARCIASATTTLELAGCR